jgi:hypothetical protein
MSNPEYKPVTVGNWIITFIVLAIPLVNLVMLIVWAVGGTTHPSKKTFAQAYFVLVGIAVCVGIALAFILPIFHHKSPTGPAV